MYFRYFLIRLMEEKDIENEIKDKNNIINMNSINNNIKIEENKSLDNIINDNDEENRKTIDMSFLKEEKVNEIKMGHKILCPKQNCYENCIIIIDPNSLGINYECGEHNNKNRMGIINFVQKSGISKEESEKCSNTKCSKTYKEIKEAKKKLYKCYCGQNFCEDCKNAHIKENENNKKGHNMIDFEVKDYLCNCSAKRKKFINYCLICKKNLCILCSGEHKDHKKKKFGELYQLSDEKKQKLQYRLEIQKKLITKFNMIIDDWLKRIKKTIDIYKQKLKLYNEINYTIFKQYNKNKNYYEAIKNIEYIRTDFDQNFMDLINHIFI